MSEAKEVKKSSIGIVNIIVAMLNLGDNGKLESFFGRAVKALTTEIKQIENDLKTKMLKLTTKVESVEDKLEDAMEDLNNAYASIDMSEIQSNGAQDSYREVYFSNIEAVEAKIVSLRENLDDLKTKIKAVKAEAKDDIQVRRDRIKKIS